MNRYYWAILLIFVAFLAVRPLMKKSTPTPGTFICASEQKAFCSGVRPGEGRVIRCLRQHAAFISTSCKNWAFSQKLPPTVGTRFNNACGNQVKTLCKGVRPGEGRIIRCLLEKNKQTPLPVACAQVTNQLHASLPAAFKMPAQSPAKTN
jgi:hypothetical protein